MISTTSARPMTALQKSRRMNYRRKVLKDREGTIVCRAGLSAQGNLMLFHRCFREDSGTCSSIQIGKEIRGVRRFEYQISFDIVPTLTKNFLNAFVCRAP